MNLELRKSGKKGPASLLSLLAASTLLLAAAAPAHAWWNNDWTVRKKITVDATAEGGNISDPIGTSAVLLRLHDGNFDFGSAKEDGGDIRFVAADDKTLLPYHIEKYDSLLNEAFVWVKVPDVKPGAPTSIWLYYGNPSEKAEKADNAKGTFDADTLLDYHFSQKGSPADSTGNANNAENAAIPVDGSLIGGGMQLDGHTKVTIPASATLNWSDRDPLTWSAWIKPSVLAPNAVLFSRREGGNAFVIGLDNGTPYVEVTDAAGTHRSAGGAALAAGGWHHLAVVADDAKITIYVDGAKAGTLAAPLPALKSASILGGEESGGAGFAGEIDELEISRVARPAGWIALEAKTQGGTDAADKTLKLGEDEAHSGGPFAFLSGGFGIMGTLLKSVTVDGWVVIGVLFIMGTITWIVMITKFFYLRRVERGTAQFIQEWQTVATDLTKLDEEEVKIGAPKTSGEDEEEETPDDMHASPIYRIYHIGSVEIRNRVNAGKKSLGARAIQAIRASLDGGMVRENQNLNSHLVFLTIAIAGGPFMGLLGTVIGVMITFAEIAASGEVNINAIAPGIAAALIATVAGLVVAIPALFGYNYLVSKIKEVTNTTHVFIDEFITKMAEFYHD
jgi:biopolymer transport protein ExbB